MYVLSNIGSFGEGIYKIGMTRRLEPLDRVYELGDSSVPFRFDVHALIYTEDAPRLENALHKEFAARRINRINLRREYFRVALEERFLTQMYARFRPRQVGHRSGKTLRMCPCRYAAVQSSVAQPTAACAGPALGGGACSAAA